MTDAEIICTWMSNGKQYGYPWWTVVNNGPFLPRVLTLDALHEVEERLTDEQWRDYEGEIACLGIIAHGQCSARFKIHLCAEQKIAALASVLKPGEVKP